MVFYGIVWSGQFVWLRLNLKYLHVKITLLNLLRVVV